MKEFIPIEQLRTDSFKLASAIEKDFKPNYMVAIWRGGAPIGCYVHEYFKYKGHNVDHIAIRTSRYTGINETQSQVQVHNLGYLCERLKSTDRVLLVDDVFDSGLSIQAVIEALKTRLSERCPTEIRVATVYYKPQNNKTTLVPDYYVRLSNAWLVFPHEVEGLSKEEISEYMGKEVGELF